MVDGPPARRPPAAAAGPGSIHGRPGTVFERSPAMASPATAAWWGDPAGGATPRPRAPPGGWRLAGGRRRPSHGRDPRGAPPRRDRAGAWAPRAARRGRGPG